MHQACYYDQEEQDESLCLPFQAMQHGVGFDLTPTNRRRPDGGMGTQKMIISDREIPLQYDGRKMFVNIRRPSEEELDLLESYELTSPNEFIPDSTDEIISRRKHNQRVYKQYPGGITMDEWRKRLALAPEDVVRKTFQATTQMAMNIEAENREIPRKHYVSRFPFLKEKRLNDIFHSDTFFPSVSTNRGETCSQLFIGRKTDYMSVHPLKTESHNFQALQDFSRRIGIPQGIKSDNAKSEVGQKWTDWCRQYCVDQSFTEPMSPWQNCAEQGIGDLGRMVARCMRAFNAPPSRHGWCQLWCKDVRNHLASRKLDWRTPTERLTGNTPDISVFRFHFWQPIEYFDHSVKQPDDGWLPGRFLGIAWESGDSMTYHVETDKPKGHGRNVILVRSTVRPRIRSIHPSTSDTSASGEPTTEQPNFKVLSESKTSESTPPADIPPSQSHTDIHNPEVTPEDADVNWEEDSTPGIEDEDQALVDENIIASFHNEEEDFEFDQIIGHHWEEGNLILNVQLMSGQTYNAPFSLIKKDRPIELAKYIRREVVERRRGGWYENWAKGVLKQSSQTLRRMHRYHRTDRINRTHHVKNITLRRLSRNKRQNLKRDRVKYGIKVPNSVKEALELDKLNKNNLWGEAILKELGALQKAGVFSFYPPTHKVGKEYQYCPLRIIFDIKQEDLRRKARMVAGGHVIDSSMYESYSSVVQMRTIRLLETVAMNEGLQIMTGDIGNAFVHAFTKEKIYSVAGKEFGDREGCKIIIKKALYGLATSARQWNLALGDMIRKLGFVPSRADPDLWIKESPCKSHYEYIATYVDDIIIVCKDPKIYMKQIKEVFPIRNEEISPSYYLGSNICLNTDGTMKISSEKYIKEVLRRYQDKNGPIREEKIPVAVNDHPEEDDTPELNEEGITEFQSIIGVCQWISTAGRFDITFAVSSLSRFCANPREGHLRRAIKILGYLKKYPKRGYLIDPREPILNVDYDDVKPDFGHQYHDFQEEIDDRLPVEKMKELSITIFCDSNHGHDKRTGKSISGIIVFVGRTPIYWSSKRQSSVQTSTFGAEFIALKKAVEEAITTRYWLRSMGVKVSKPAIIYGDNLSAITNVTVPGSTLNKKYLALAYHFCREHFSANIVNIRKIDGKDNFADPFTKPLVNHEFHGHMNDIMAK